MVALLLPVISTGGCRRGAQPPSAPEPPRFRYGFNRVENPQTRPFPAPTPRRPGVSYLELFVIGDQGTGLPGQHLIARRMAEQAKREGLDLVLTVGDNIYPRGVTSVDDPQWKTKFESVYLQPELQVPFYATLGNHDRYQNPRAQVQYTNRSSCRCECDANRRCRCRRLDTRRKCWIMPRRYYTFRRALAGGVEVQLFALDTSPLAYPKHYPQGDREQIAWLERELKASSARWKVVFGHHPIVSGGRHGPNRLVAAAIRPLLERYGVQLYLCGHDHDLQLLHPAGSTTTYVVSGAGGKSRDVRYLRETLFAETNFGFVSIRLDAEAALIRFFDRAGTMRFAHRLVAPPTKR